MRLDRASLSDRRPVSSLGVSAGLEQLLTRLDLAPDPVRPQTWIGSAGTGSLNRSQNLFGGLIAAQVIMAAGRSQPDRRVHAVQQVFLRAGNVVDPLHYQVASLFEGHVHATVLVAVEQAGEIISHAQVGFTRGRSGQADIDEPVAWGGEPPADAVDRERFRRATRDDHTPPIEMQVRETQQRDRSPDLDIWLRTGGDPGDDALRHLALLGYASDRGMLSVAGKVLGEPDGLVMSTVNHNLWFHRPIDLRAWHLHRS